MIARLARHAPTVASFALTLLLIIATVVYAPQLVTASTIKQQLVFATFIGIAALGQTIVILAGGLDLSVPFVLSFGAIQLNHFAGLPGPVAILAVVVLGGVIGALNGIGVVLLDVSPIVMTIATGGIVQGYLLAVGTGGASGKVAAAQYLVTGQVGPVPMVAVVWALLAVAVWLLLSRTVFGRKVLAVGTNDRAAWLSGVDVRRTRFATYVISGAASAFAGILLVGFIGQAYLGMGTPYLFASIAAVVIGGASVLGGHGSYWGTVAGALSLTVISVLLPQLELSEAQLQVVYGLIILAGIYLARAGLVVAQRQRSTPASTDTDQAADGMRTHETKGVTR